jgi:4-hydroxybenzoate polyprenyltransferase
MATLFAAGARKPDARLFVATLLPALSMYVVYTFDKVVQWDPVADAENDPDRSAFIGKHRSALLALAAVALGLGIVLAYLSPGGLRAVALFAIPFPIAYAYGTNVLPAGFRYRRLKDVTGGKSLTVAATWALVGVTLPIVAASQAVSFPLHAALFGWLLVRFFVNTVFFDIGDIDGDTRAGTRTIPVVLGAERTYALLEVAVLGSVVLGVVSAALSPTKLAMAAIVLANGAFDLWFVREGRRSKNLGFLCDVVADGMGLFAAATVVAGAVFGV